MNSQAKGEQSRFVPGLYKYCIEDTETACMNEDNTVAGDSYTFFENFTGTKTEGKYAYNFKWKLVNNYIIIASYNAEIKIISVLNNNLIRYDGNYWTYSRSLSYNNKPGVFNIGYFSSRRNYNGDIFHVYFENDGTGLYSVEKVNGKQTLPMMWTMVGNTITLTIISSNNTTYTLEVVDYNTLMLNDTYLCYEY
jgi:hypothetical protein